MMVCDVTLAPFYAIRRTHVLTWGMLAANAIAFYLNDGKKGFMCEKCLL